MAVAAFPAVRFHIARGAGLPTSLREWAWLRSSEGAPLPRRHPTNADMTSGTSNNTVPLVGIGELGSRLPEKLLTPNNYAPLALLTMLTLQPNSTVFLLCLWRTIHYDPNCARTNDSSPRLPNTASPLMSATR